jgi:hypothetical protein
MGQRRTLRDGDCSRGHRPESPIPAELRSEVVRFSRNIAKKHRKVFVADRGIKLQVLRLMQALLPPRPRPRGRPGDPSVTHAMKLHSKFRRQFPKLLPRELWVKVYPLAINGWEGMTDLERCDARQTLHDRVVWRLRKRRPRRKNHLQIPVS